MTIQHHPADDLLLSYAAGSADEPLALVLATHLALCPRCRKGVGQAEAAGGALLETGTPAPLGADALQSVLSRLDEPFAKPMFVARTPSNVPEPLRSYVGNDLERVGWTHIVGGISFRTILTHGSARAQLIRSRPGSGVGTHTHRSEELTLCLSGGYTDVTGQYARGYLQTTTPDVLHRPLADEGEDCIVLAMSDAPLLFRNWGVAMIAKWFGF